MLIFVGLGFTISVFEKKYGKWAWCTRFHPSIIRAIRQKQVWQPTKQIVYYECFGQVFEITSWHLKRNMDFKKSHFGTVPFWHNQQAKIGYLFFRGHMIFTLTQKLHFKEKNLLRDTHIFNDFFVYYDSATKRHNIRTLWLLQSLMYNLRSRKWIDPTLSLTMFL